MIPRYYTTAEVADICRVKPNTVRIWRMKGKLKVAGHTVGGLPLHLLEDFIHTVPDSDASEKGEDHA